MYMPSRPAVSGRLRPFIFSILVMFERPLSGKADIQILDFEKSLHRPVEVTTQSSRSTSYALLTETLLTRSRLCGA